MAIEQDLEKVGLNGKEARVYLALLELGQASVVALSRKSGLKRTTIYEILKSLLEKGLVTEVVFGKRRKFTAEPPEKFFQLKKIEIETLRNLIPTLEALRNVAIEKPSLQFFEGDETIKQIFTDMILNTDPIKDRLRGIETKTNTDILLGRFGDQFWIDLLQKKKARGLESFIIDTLSKEEYVEFQKKYPWSTEHELTSRFIPDLEKKFNVNLYFYQNKMAFIAADQLIALLISNQRLKDSFEFLFDRLWEAAKSTEQKFS